MSEQPLLPIAVQPMISYPREAEVGKTYLMTIDLKVAEGSEWQFEEEEYPIYCMVDSEPLFRCEAVGEPAIVLHRFGGSYGEAKFLLKAMQIEMEGEIGVTLVNGWGMPIKSIKLERLSVNGSELFESEKLDLATQIEVVQAIEPESVERNDEEEVITKSRFSIRDVQQAIDDRFPDVCCMSIEGVPVPYERSSDSFSRNLFRGSSNQIDLYLTIQFNEQWCKLPAGRVRIGINGGELRLKLENGEIPLDSRSLCGSLSQEVSYKRTKKDGQKDKAGIKADIKGGNLSSEREETSKTSDKFQLVVCQVTTKGSDTEPVWVFEESQGERVMKGLLKKTKLATVSITANPCIIRARFEVSAKNIQLTAAEGIWTASPDSRKRITLDSLIVSRLLKGKVQPYLSEQKLIFSSAEELSKSWRTS